MKQEDWIGRVTNTNTTRGSIAHRFYMAVLRNDKVAEQKAMLEYSRSSRHINKEESQ